VLSEKILHKCRKEVKVQCTFAFEELPILLELLKLHQTPENMFGSKLIINIHVQKHISRLPQCFLEPNAFIQNQTNVLKITKKSSCITRFILKLDMSVVIR
jgi:hypothetical protein